MSSARAKRFKQVPKYWMVHNVTTGGATRVMHETRDEAAAEARRLAEKSPQFDYVVLEAVAIFRLFQPGPRREVVQPPSYTKGRLLE